ncbi:uroporphyrinogen-III C-methyltransferase [Arhodomonas sp. AD133]|uniref:uroporphyrinogen-III C-methyltransferase n=1 Tax=Arhodomonas sp. AD133 TaxID=3415009 RepID=UPI003EBA4785
MTERDNDKHEETPPREDSAVESADESGTPGASDSSGGTATGTQASTPPGTAAPAGGGSGTGLAIAAFVIALLALVVVLAGGWWGWQRYQAFADSQRALVSADRLGEATDALEERIAELRGRVSSLDERTAGRDQAIAGVREAIEGVRQTQSDITARMDRIAEMAQVSRDDWRRSEAAYLANVAVHRVRYYRDADAALGALKEADELLSALGGEAIAERKAIRETIDALLAAKQPKTDDISEALTALAGQIDDLALRSGAAPLPETTDEGTGDVGETTDDAVGRAWHQFSNALGELVVVSGPEREVVPLRPASERFFLRENVKLQLYTARLAAVEGRAEIYRSSLERTQEWLRRFFDADDPAVADAIEQLTALAEQPVRSQLPEIESALAPVRQFD